MFSLNTKLAFGFTAVALVSVPSTGQADPKGKHCKELQGPFSSVTVPAPPCTSPVGLCTHGVLAGPMRNASYDFTVQTITPSPTDPTVLIAVGTSIVTTDRGQMLTDDVSILRLTGPAPTDPVIFVTTATVTSGTQHWKHTAGQFVASGVLSFATGQAQGSYTASLCRGGNGRNDQGE